MRLRMASALVTPGFETEVGLRVRRRGFMQWVSVGVLFIFERSINAKPDYSFHIAFPCTGFLQRRFIGGLFLPAISWSHHRRDYPAF